MAEIASPTKLLRLIISFYIVVVTSASIENDVCPISQKCAQNEAEISNLSKQSCIKFDSKSFNATSPSIFYGEAHGRLGNQLLGYAMLYYLREQLGFQAFIAPSCKNALLNIFDEKSVRIPVLSEFFCNVEDIKFENFEQSLADLVNNKVHRKGKIYLMWPPTQKRPHGYKPEEHLGPEQDAMQRWYVQALRKSLTFRAPIMELVQKSFGSVKKKMGGKDDITYVGIHNRRTDSFEFIRRNFHEEPLDEDFFTDAMDYFEEEYDNVAFLYVSDDMKWGLENLQKRKNLFFAGQGHPDESLAIGHDLALLVYSNHTIVTRGTFSMWAAMLCGGEYYSEYGVIVPDYLQD